MVNMKPEDAEKLFYWANPPLGEGKVVYWLPKIIRITCHYLWNNS
jgi:hypothetical protein